MYLGDLLGCFLVWWLFYLCLHIFTASFVYGFMKYEHSGEEIEKDIEMSEENEKKRGEITTAPSLAAA